jgi:guanine nucleotide-binding protein subunit alpha
VVFILIQVAAFDFLPTDADILLARVRTTGVREERFVIDKQVYQFFDVGGQRNERR